MVKTTFNQNTSSLDTYAGLILSDFQKNAIDGLLQGNHILITAHTGSGKTLPAIFAIDHFVGSLKKRIIYTSPIKALSNQKYWEFTEKFEHKGITIGLSTGDIKTNPNADVVVMTTEILMNLLFTANANANETANATKENPLEDVACIVFDEVHYINDEQRGHVWEQTILMLPPHIQMLMLSATIDNPVALAEWIEQQGSKEVWVCSTQYRAVPLIHYSFLTVGENIYKRIKDDVLKSEIRKNTHTWKTLCIPSVNTGLHEITYHETKKMLNLMTTNQQFIKRKFVINDLLKTMVGDPDNPGALPAIFFVFSRKQVEQVAHEITTVVLPSDSKIPYIIAQECESLLRKKLTNFQEYLSLPAYTDLVKLLEKGIAYHHSGMIPILRELVEWFISKKMIYVLVATESFAVGLDCPIKSAVFLSLKKHDGNEWRYLKPHEYTQMAGRAGRRGIDTIGNVIHCNNLFPLPTLTEYKEIVQGGAQTLQSKFKIQYSMVLSLLQQNGGITIEKMMSFIHKSMIYREQTKHLSEKKEKSRLLSEKIEAIYNNQIKHLSTPETVLKRHVVLTEQLMSTPSPSPKKYKEIMKELKDWKENNRSGERDLATYHIWLNLQKEKNIIENEIHFEFGLDELNGILRILLNKNVLTMSPEKDGIKNSSVFVANPVYLCSHETHPLLLPQLILHEINGSNNTRLSAKQWVSIFSVFGSAKGMEETRKHMPSCSDGVVLSRLNLLVVYARELEDLERQNLNGTVLTDIDELFMFDMTEDVLNWCDCTDAIQCQTVIQQLEERGFSLGDFMKLLLKIIAIAKEMENIANIIENVELLNTLSEIPGLLLKYIATNQSIYV